MYKNTISSLTWYHRQKLTHFIIQQSTENKQCIVKIEVVLVHTYLKMTTMSSSTKHETTEYTTTVVVIMTTMFKMEVTDQEQRVNLKAEYFADFFSLIITLFHITLHAYPIVCSSYLKVLTFLSFFLRILKD